jgi:hypothetical protein
VSTSPDFPSAFRLNGRLMWERHGIENYKRILMGLEPVERDPQTPITFVSAKQLTEELPFGRRTLGRRVKDRVKAEPQPDATEAV